MKEVSVEMMVVRATVELSKPPVSTITLQAIVPLGAKVSVTGTLAVRGVGVELYNEAHVGERLKGHLTLETKPS